MPFQKERYPENWKEISLRIREREGQKCLWCGLKNGAIGYRDKDGNFHEEDAQTLEVMYLVDRSIQRITKIVLTVAHLGTPHADGSPGDKHDKMDVRDSPNVRQPAYYRYLKRQPHEHQMHSMPPSCGLPGRRERYQVRQLRTNQHTARRTQFRAREMHPLSTRYVSG